MIEVPHPKITKTHRLTVQNIFFYEDKESNYKSTLGEGEIVMHTILLIDCILYLTKILFELSIGINRITNFLEMANLSAMFIFIIIKYTEVILKNQEYNRLDMTDTKTFHNFQIFVSIEQVYSISLAVGSIFYPFRLFQFLAHFNTFNPAKTIINTVCRTTPGMIVYLVCVVLMVLGWTMGVYVTLSPLFPEFNSFWRSLFTMVCSNFQLIETYHSLSDQFLYNDMKLATI